MKQYPNTARALEPVLPRAKYLHPRDRRTALRACWARASVTGRRLAGVSQSELALELGVQKHFIGHAELPDPCHRAEGWELYQLAIREVKP